MHCIPIGNFFSNRELFYLTHIHDYRAWRVAHTARCATTIVMDKLSHDMLQSLLQVVTSVKAPELVSEDVSCFLSLHMLSGIHSLAKMVGIEVEPEGGWAPVITLFQICLIGNAAHPPSVNF